jgi:L-alanine-DL-glutamate epimerase-like enolase superfamily enzyme
VGGGLARVEVLPVALPLRTPYRIATAVQTVAEYVLVRVETSDGHVGVGEAAPFPGETEATAADVAAVLRAVLVPAALGADPADLEALHARLDRATPGHLWAKAALDLACHDALGRRLGVSVGALLGGRVRDVVELSGGPIGLMAPEAAAATARALVAEGFRTLKLKVGAGPAHDEATVRAVREAVGGEVALRLDANQAYSAAEAVRAMRRLERYDPVLVEQPVPAWDLDGLARVAAALDVPVMADEPVATPSDVLRVAERRAADVVKVKVMRAGGLHRARKVVAVAEAAGLPVVLGSGHESGVGVAAELHLAAACRAIPWAGEMVGHLRLVEDVVEPPIVVKAGAAVPPDGPGLGVRLRAAVVARGAAGEGGGTWAGTATT